MKVTGLKVVVTGGAGFIGSHLVDKLLELKNDVLVIDDLRGGSEDFISHHYKDPYFKFVKKDLLKCKDLEKMFKGKDIIFHLAANPDVKSGATNPHIDVEQNLIVTHVILEAMRTSGVKTIVFTSTSTVYGEAKIIPTPEDYGPNVPISLYAASKLGAESLIDAYCHTFDMNAVIYRFANCVGSRSTHGVTFDFVNKLRKDPTVLDILGDGKACKSYFHVSDCVDAMIFGVEHSRIPVDFFNVGSKDYIDVNRVADIVVKAMDLKGVRYNYTGGTKTGAGWIGDVKVMRLAIDRLGKLGWTPKYDSSESIRLTAESCIKG
jgi:UDP-glucose 4-epimerase